MSQVLDDEEEAQLLKKFCKRRIHTHKFEEGELDSRRWWYSVFDKLEKEYSIKPYERLDVIQQLFPDIEKRLTTILNFKRADRDHLELERQERKRAERAKEIHSTGSYGSRYGGAISMETMYLEYGEETTQNNVGTHNPYTQFFNTRPDRAAIWRELPPLSLEEMNLTQKAAAITEAIAQHFCDWLKSIGGDEKPTLDVNTIIKMFEIGFNYHAATSLCVRVKELPAVSDPIAESRQLPQASVRANLHALLKHDLKAFKTKDKLVAFGKMLPLELRSKPPKEDFVKKWLQCKRVPRKLATMEAVWGGIEGLRSTRAFCGWLINHPEIPPPVYLEDKGMLDINFLVAPHYSVEDLAEATIDLGGIGESIGTAVHNATEVQPTEAAKPAEAEEE